jgi:hypothetical protein
VRWIRQSGYVEGQNVAIEYGFCSHGVRCNIGEAAVCKASIAAAVLALGIVSLVQEGTNAMVALPAGLRPAVTMPAVETVALRKSGVAFSFWGCFLDQPV